MKFKYQKFPIGHHDPNKPLIPRPFIPVYLVREKQEIRTPCYALLDSGADRVIFPSDLAIEIDIINIETGLLEPTIGIANQKTDVYYHKLLIRVLGDTRLLPIEVGFSKNVVLPILGRSFFRHFKSVVFNELKEEIELKN